jgi:hypothetical protein
MEYLTQPRQVPIFTEDILSVLLNYETGDLGLVYYYCVSPSLINPELLQKFFEKLCRSSITEAYYFYRKQPDSQRRPLFEILLNIAIAHSSSRPARTVELLELPLEKIEEQWLEESLLAGDQRKSKGAADIVLMRKLAMGQLRESAEFLQTSRVSKGSFNDVTWGNVVHGLDRGMGPRNFQDIYETE